MPFVGTLDLYNTRQKAESAIMADIVEHMITTKILMKTMMIIPIPKPELYVGRGIILQMILKTITIPITPRLQMMQ